MIVSVHQDTNARIGRKLLPPLPRYTNQSVVDTMRYSRGSSGSGVVSDFTHFTAARASSGIASPSFPSPTALGSRRSVVSSTIEV